MNPKEFPQIEACFSPRDFYLYEEDFEVVVVIDVLRATSAICAAIENGVEGIIPVATVEDARAYLDKGYIAAAEREGKIVEGFTLGWQEYAIANPASIRKINPALAPIQTAVGVLGMPGMTAFFGLLHIGKPIPGDTVVVSAASGAVGQLVGQIAKIGGCHVVGIAGGKEKCDYLTNTLNFDAAIDYKNQNVDDMLDKYCPNGVNVYFDNVAGSTLDAVLENMANFGVIAVCGLLENYASKERLPGPYNYDLILMKRLRFEGFFSPDFYHREAEINPILKKWDKSGHLKLPIEITDGLENLVSAYSKLFEGSNIGKVVVKV